MSGLQNPFDGGKNISKMFFKSHYLVIKNNIIRLLLLAGNKVASKFVAGWWTPTEKRAVGGPHHPY